jgi:hypothetical protein
MSSECKKRTNDNKVTIAGALIIYVEYENTKLLKYTYDHCILTILKNGYETNILFRLR